MSAGRWNLGRSVLGSVIRREIPVDVLALALVILIAAGGIGLPIWVLLAVKPLYPEAARIILVAVALAWLLTAGVLLHQGEDAP